MLEKVGSKREIVTLVVLILTFLKDIQVEMSRRLWEFRVEALEFGNAYREDIGN